MPDAPLFSDPALVEVGAIRLREERDVGSVLSAALRLAISEARSLFTAVFAIVGPMILAAALVRSAGGAVGGAFLGSVVDGAASLLATVTALAFVRLYMRGDPLSVADVWDEAKPLIGPVFVLLLVVVIGLVGLLIPVSLIVAATGGGVMTGALAVLVFGAFVLVGVPLVSLSLAAVGLDEMRAVEALARIRDLTRDRLGLVLGTLVLLVGLALFMLFILGGTLGVFFGSTVSGDDPSASPSMAVASAVLTLIALPVSVVISLVWAVLYGSLVEAAEGPSLGRGLDSLSRALDDRPATEAHASDPARTPETPVRPDAPSDALGRLLDGPEEPASLPPPPADSPDGAPAGGFRGGGFRSGESSGSAS
ncbi:MAG TPA: hypothetical protein VF594_00675 [Rubricoccaceae bacterium]|jgi:hypothetical protein